MSNRPNTAVRRDSQKKNVDDDLISHKSFTSKISRASMASHARTSLNDDAKSIAPSMVSKAPTESSIDEADEWTAILKFNALLHYEEQKQAAARAHQRKVLMKQELEE